MSDFITIMKHIPELTKPFFFLLPPLFGLFLWISALVPYAAAIEALRPIERLRKGFFPTYLGTALGSYFKGDISGCYGHLEKISLTPYTQAAEKYFLLKALCSPTELRPKGATDLIEKALRERGSSSDVLYGAALILVQLELNEEAIKRFQEAIWFDGFQHFDRKDFYLDYGRFQFHLGLLGEAKVSLEEAITLGSDSIDAKSMLTDIAINSGDRRLSISLSREVSKLRPNLEAKEALLRALMVSAVPVFHKKDIEEAARIAEKLGEDSMRKLEVSIAAAKALMLTHQGEKAEGIVGIALGSHPQDPRLLALAQQIREEREALALAATPISNSVAP